jgi:transposase
MDAEKMEALARRIEATGNVTESCLELGVARSAYYKWLKKHGQAPAPRRRHPHAMAETTAERVLELARRHPDWGCDRISHYLYLHGTRLSGTSIQKFLTARGLGKESQRRDHAAGNP